MCAKKGARFSNLLLCRKEKKRTENVAVIAITPCTFHAGTLLSKVQNMFDGFLTEVYCSLKSEENKKKDAKNQ